MEELQGTGTYKEFKTTLDTELSKAAEGFVKIGYLLRIAKDTDILHESGYVTVADFAKAEYGLTKDIVSRYIAINERFSEGGYSEKLKEDYRGYGVAKLAEMLTLPDSVVESMSPLMTKTEIQEIKKEIKKEEQITDIEVMLEEKKEFQKNLSSDLRIALNQYYYEQKEQYCTIWYTFANQNRDKRKDIDKILDVMAPSGIKMIGTRPKGLGSFMISIRGKDMDIDVIITREQRTEHYTWSDMVESIESICKSTETPQESWENIYGEEYTVEKKIEEVAPVQQNDVRKEEEVQQNRTEERKEEKKQEITKENIEETKQVDTRDEQIPGQAYIEDYKEVLPDRDIVEKANIITGFSVEEGKREPLVVDEHTVVVVTEETRQEEGCKFCNGEEVITSHDGDFTLKVTERGYISVRFDNGEHQESAIFELKRCPECGKLLREE